MKGKGKEKAQQGKALQKQVQHEEQKHLKRKVRLERMLEVAKEKGDQEAVDRIQSLIDKEQGRYEKKQAKMTGRGEKDGDGKENKAEDDSDNND